MAKNNIRNSFYIDLLTVSALVSFIVLVNKCDYLIHKCYPNKC